MHGILLVDKPKNWTSFDVVAKVRSLITKSPLNSTGKKRFPVGHTGTLDPLATGLLVLLLGSDTKLAPKLTKLDKTYEVTMRLGQTSTTGDEEGEKHTISTHKTAEAELRHALEQFCGEIMQTPPMHSAIKVHGQRAYKLARQGNTVELEPRKVVVHSIVLTKYDYPIAQFTTVVSSGTYIRALVQDVGERLGVGAYMSDLRRTRVGSFSVSDAIQVSDMSVDTIQAYTKLLSDA